MCKKMSYLNPFSYTITVCQLHEYVWVIRLRHPHREEIRLNVDFETLLGFLFHCS